MELYSRGMGAIPGELNSFNTYRNTQTVMKLRFNTLGSPSCKDATWSAQLGARQLLIHGSFGLHTPPQELQ